MPRSRISLSAYRPRPGKEAAFLAAMPKEVALLRSRGHITQRPAPICRTPRREYLVIIEWATETSVDDAHADTAVLAAWRHKDELAEYIGPGELAASDVPFVSYDVVADA